MDGSSRTGGSVNRVKVSIVVSLAEGLSYHCRFRLFGLHRVCHSHLGYELIWSEADAALTQSGTNTSSSEDYGSNGV